MNNMIDEKKTKRLRFYIKTRFLKKINSGLERGTIADKSASVFIWKVIEENMIQGPINYSIHNNRVAVIEVIRNHLDDHLHELQKVERVIMADIEFIKLMEEDDA